MEKFKQTIKNRMIRNLILGISLIPLAVITATHYFTRKVLFSGSPVKEFISGFFNGVQSTIVAGFIFYLFCMAIHCYKTHKDDAQLKELYIKENDEREHAILYCATKSTINIINYLLLVVSLIAGWFNAIVSITLLITWAILSVIYLLFIGYYSRKM